MKKASHSNAKCLLRFTGRIEINGVENTRTEAKRQLGYIPEMPAVYDLLTVEEHLEFIRRAYKVEDEAYTQRQVCLPWKLHSLLGTILL